MDHRTNGKTNAERNRVIESLIAVSARFVLWTIGKRKDEYRDERRDEYRDEQNHRVIYWLPSRLYFAADDAIVVDAACFRHRLAKVDGQKAFGIHVQFAVRIYDDATQHGMTH